MRDQDTAKAGPKGSPKTAPARSAAAPSADPTGILTLQRSIGNAAVVQLLAEAGDPYSRDGHGHGPGCGHGHAAPVQRSEVQSVLSSPGRPLAGPMRAEMETRLGADFSDVRLHTGSAARRSAAEIGARAYTSGSHVVIGDGGADKHTLAHELTHVIQQRRGPVAGTDNGSGLKVSDPSDRFEREAEANATRALGTPLPAADAAGVAATDSVQRAAVPGTAAAPSAPSAPTSDTGQIQRAPGTGILERGKAAVKKGAAKLDHGAGHSAPAANFMGGAFATAGNTPGDFGRAGGIGAAAMVSGALAVPDLAGSVFQLCSRYSAWWHASEEERPEALKKLLATCSEVTSNASAVAGGLVTGAGALGTLPATTALGEAGGGLGIVTGLITAIKSSVKAYKSYEQTEKLKKAPFPRRNFKELLSYFENVKKLLGENHKHALMVMHDQVIAADQPLRKLPASARDRERAAVNTRFSDLKAALDTRFELAQTTVDHTIKEVQEAANLQAAKELGIRKGERRTVRSMLTALGGTLGVPAGALSIVAVALGLTAGAIPIAGWAITGVVGLIAAGVLTWELIYKVRANLKHMASDPAFKDYSGWRIFFEATKVWKPKVGSARERAAEALFDGLSSEFDQNKAGAEALVRALSLDPAELLKGSDRHEAIETIKGRLAST